MGSSMSHLEKSHMVMHAYVRRKAMTSGPELPKARCLPLLFDPPGPQFIQNERINVHDANSLFLLNHVGLSMGLGTTYEHIPVYYYQRISVCMGNVSFC